MKDFDMIAKLWWGSWVDMMIEDFEETVDELIES